MPCISEILGICGFMSLLAGREDSRFHNPVMICHFLVRNLSNVMAVIEVLYRCTGRVCVFNYRKLDQVKGRWPGCWCRLPTCRYLGCSVHVCTTLSVTQSSWRSLIPQLKKWLWGKRSRRHSQEMDICGAMWWLVKGVRSLHNTWRMQKEKLVLLGGALWHNQEKWVRFKEDFIKGMPGK